jgi:hypothetical protein
MVWDTFFLELQGCNPSDTKITRIIILNNIGANSLVHILFSFIYNCFTYKQTSKYY